MSLSEIDRRLNQVAIMVMSARPKDRENSSKIRAALQTLGEWSDATDSFKQAVAAAIADLDRVILKEIPFAQGMPLVLDALGRAREAFSVQQKVQSDRDAADLRQERPLGRERAA